MTGSIPRIGAETNDVDPDPRAPLPARVAQVVLGLLVVALAASILIACIAGVWYVIAETMQAIRLNT